MYLANQINHFCSSKATPDSNPKQKKGANRKPSLYLPKHTHPTLLPSSSEIKSRLLYVCVCVCICCCERSKGGCEYDILLEPEPDTEKNRN